MFFEIDPALAVNQRIRDLQYAHVNQRGRVEFSADLDKARESALYDINNRGNKVAFRLFNDASSGNSLNDPGNGFLLRHGWILVWSGWDGELLPGSGRMQLDAPVARSSDSPITGPMRYEIYVSDDEVNRVNHGAYLPTERGLQETTLTWQLRLGDVRVPIPRDQFHLHIL